MKILELNGSPRSHGNTRRILELCNIQFEIIKMSSKLSIDYEMVNIYDQNLKWCKGCRNCFNFSEEKCPQKDNLIVIKNQMEQADCIIIGSPVYVEDVSGGVKNFLDRMAFNCHRPFLIGKPIYCFTTSASLASTHALKTLKRAFLSWGGQVKVLDNFQMGTGMNLENTQDIFGKKVEEAVRMIIKEATMRRTTIYELISFGIQKRYWERKKGTVDYEYWKKRGWLKSDCRYYKETKVNYFKQLIATIISKVVLICMK